MRRGPRTIRQRRGRARKGQVSAVATILGLLLVVTFISEFVIQPLPAEMASVEFTHIAQVANQLGRLQATVLAQARNPSVELALSSPVTLGSGSMPPWAGPSSASLTTEATSVKLAGTYQLSHVVAAPPLWGVGSSCLMNGSGHCSSNGNLDSWNITNVNNSFFNLTVNGNRNSMAYNISGNNNTIAITWTGGDTGYVNIIVNGSDDVVTMNKGGSDSTNPIINFWFYGQRDVFNYNPSGSSSSKASVTVNVAFIGSWNQICPYGNASATDKLGALGTGGTNLNFTATWWNLVGYVSPPHKVVYPGGASSNEYLIFENNTGVLGCAFTKTYASTYSTQLDSGIVVHLLNHYQPPTDLAYDQGAVIETAEGGQSIMLSPPQFSFSVLPEGISATLVLVNLIGNVNVVAGTETAAVTTTVLGVSSFTVRNGLGSLELTSPLFFNVTTYYPAAWANYFAGVPQLVPNGASCLTLKALPTGFTCLAPPFGTPERISAALDAQDLTVETINVAVAVE